MVQNTIKNVKDYPILTETRQKQMVVSWDKERRVYVPETVSWIDIDTEFNSPVNQVIQYLFIQARSPKGNFLFLHPDVQDIPEVIQAWNSLPKKLENKIGVWELIKLPSIESIFTFLIDVGEISYREDSDKGEYKLFAIDYYYFLAFADVLAGLPRRLWNHIQSQVERKRVDGVKGENDEKGDNQIRTGILVETVRIKNGKEVKETMELGIELKDQSGRKQGGLADAAQIANVPQFDTSLKDLPKSKKEDMIRSFISEPLKIVNYAINDVICKFIDENFTKLFKDEIVFWGGSSHTHIPQTTGAGVHKILSEYGQTESGYREAFTKIVEKYGEDAIWKIMQVLGVQNISLEDYQAWFTTPKGNITEQSYKQGLGKAYRELWKGLIGFLSAKELTNKAIAGHKLVKGSAFLAPVKGGFCKSFNVAGYKIVESPIVDQDISGAYAGAMKLLNMFIGIPQIFSGLVGYKDGKVNFDKCIPFKKALKIIGANENFHMVVRTKEKLSFRQQIIFSKVMKPEEVVKNEFDKKWAGFAEIDDKGREDAHFKGDFCLTENEVQYGSITKFSLSLLRAVASNEEWKELMDKLEVIALVVYPDSEECETIYEYLEGAISWYEKHGGYVQLSDEGDLNTNHKRYPKHFRIPLKPLIDHYLDKRKEAKKERAKVQKQFGKESMEYAKWNAIQEFFKLINNTAYGVLVSPYFIVANVLTGNQITDYVRMIAFTMRASHKTMELITDGGWSSMNEVVYLNRGMSINTLSSYSRIENTVTKKGRIKHLPMGYLDGVNEDWIFSHVEDRDGNVWMVFQSGEYTLKTFDENDELYLKGEFIGSANINKWYKDEMLAFFQKPMEKVKKLKSFPFDLEWLKEVKFGFKDCYIGAVGHGQADYAFLKRDKDGNDKWVAKGRGWNKKGKYYNDEGIIEGCPIQTLMLNLYDDLIEYPEGEIKTTTFLKPNEWNERYYAKKSNIIQENNLHIGCTIEKTKTVKVISPSMFFYPDHATKVRWEKLDMKLHKVGMGLINLKNHETYQGVITTIQTIIDEGKCLRVDSFA